VNKLAAIFLLIVLLSGCAIGPDYKRPEVINPSVWRFEDKQVRDTANIAWWEQFNDPVLNQLIQTALKENYDIRIAASRVDEYLGRYWVGRSGLFPQITGSASAQRQQISSEGPLPITAGAKNPSPVYDAAVLGNWELDIWGKWRRTTEAARADLLSTKEARQAVILSLVSTVAIGYINLRDLDKQLDIAKRTVKSRADSYNLFRIRYEGGVISELELNQTKSEYETALATIPQIEKSIAFQEDALSTLLGKNPGPVLRGRNVDNLSLPAVPSGLPSDLLERRPDIRQAEQSLIAANARIGVAKAQYFPSISLTGLFGWASTELSSLFNGSAQQWSWGGVLNAPIFLGGAIKGQVQTAEAIQKEALYSYQSTIQTAFREVEDALADQKFTRQQLAAQGQAVDTLREYARIARLRYDEGYTSYIEVLDSERNLFNAELQYAQIQGVLFASMINLYKSMGGGWVAKAEQMITDKVAGERISSSEGK
jgi:multidrug efflux system outer membrane protein